MKYFHYAICALQSIMYGIIMLYFYFFDREAYNTMLNNFEQDVERIETLTRLSKQYDEQLKEIMEVDKQITEKVKANYYFLQSLEGSGVEMPPEYYTTKKIIEDMIILPSIDIEKLM